MSAVFGRYELLEEVDRAGSGTVYKGFDAATQREVAIKVLPAALSGVPGYAERFREEALATGRLGQQHVLPVIDADEADGRLFMVMPFVDGTDLQRLIERQGPIAPERAVHIVEQVAAALDSAADAGLIHRGVKPSDVLIADQDFTYLTNFGIADGATPPETWAYTAPERFTAGTVDRRGDVYSLACVLYQCLTGAQPFPGSGMEQQVQGHCYIDPPRPSAVNPALPAALDAVIARGMAKDPAQRFATASELARAATQSVRQPGRPDLAPGIPADLYDINVHRSDLPEPVAPAPEVEEPVTADDELPTLSKPPAEPPKPKARDSKGIRRKIMIAVMSALAAVSVLVPIVSSFMATRGKQEPIPTAPTTTSKPAYNIKPLSVRPVVSAFVTTPDQCPPPPPAPIPPDKPLRICDIERTAVYELSPEAMKVQLTNVDSFLNPLTGVQLVQMTMTNESAEEFTKFTAGQVGKQVAFVRAGTVVWGPKIGAPIEGQVLQLSGDLTAEQGKTIAKMLRDES